MSDYRPRNPYRPYVFMVGKLVYGPCTEQEANDYAEIARKLQSEAVTISRMVWPNQYYAIKRNLDALKGDGDGD